MHVARTNALVATLLLGACSTAPLPEGAGRGVIAFDPSPPEGIVTYERPAVAVGDRYALVRGGRVRLDFAVVEAGDDGVVVQDRGGHQLRRDAALGYLGEWDDKGEPVHLLSPSDTRFHWPLWVGKKWRCEFVDRKRDADPLMLEVAYTVEDLDRITVPAGTFEALRIVRRETLKVEGDVFLDRTSVNWYAPAIGLEVRQLVGGTAFELVEWSPAR